MGLRIVIETKPHSQQRYPTVGDWYWDPDGTTHIIVSDMGDWRREALVAVHELCEVLMCRSDGVSAQEVDDFDMQYEKLRKPRDKSEPGDHPKAPYAKQHCVATGIERILCAAFGISWKDYEDFIDAL